MVFISFLNGPYCVHEYIKQFMVGELLPQLTGSLTELTIIHNDSLKNFSRHNQTLHFIDGWFVRQKMQNYISEKKNFSRAIPASHTY